MKKMKGRLLFTLLLVAALAVLLCCHAVADETVGFAVTRESVNVRSGAIVKGLLDPGAAAYRLAANTVIYVFDTHEGNDGQIWYHITCQHNDDGTLRARQGWIPSGMASTEGLFENVTAVSAGQDGFLALRADGTVTGCARITGATASFYRDLEKLSGITSVWAGDGCYAALDAEGKETVIGTSPNGTGFGGDILLDAFGSERTVVKKDGKIYSTNPLTFVYPAEQPDMTKAAALFQRQKSAFFLMADGSVACASPESDISLIMPEGYPDFSLWTNVVSIDTVMWHPQDVYFYEVFAAVFADGTLRVHPRAVERLTDGWPEVVQVSLASDYIVAVGRDGRAYAAGRSEDIVKEVSEWTDIASVSAADKYCVGLKKDGTLVFSGKFDFEKN